VQPAWSTSDEQSPRRVGLKTAAVLLVPGRWKEGKTRAGRGGSIAHRGAGWGGRREGTTPSPARESPRCRRWVVLVKPDVARAREEHHSASPPTIRAPALSRVAALLGPTRGATPGADIVREVMGNPPYRALATGRLHLTLVA
jgi:hypothetical protein